MNDQAPQYIRGPKAPPAHIVYAHKMGRGLLTFEQMVELVKAINPAYVEGKQGKNYLAQHQARAEMNRIFGYGNWDVIEDEPKLMYEYTVKGTGNNAQKDYWIAGYRMKVTVNIRDLWGMPVATVTGTHAEENANLPNRGEAHAMAMTSVSSYALRRALINLGDRFGLGLYNGGSKNPHGQYTMSLEPGQLFDWQQVGAAAPTPPSQAPITQPSHETINAEPAVPEMYGEEQPDMQLQSPPVARPPQGQRFDQAREQVQAGNQRARQQTLDPQMAARIQAGMKVDPPRPTMEVGE